MSVEQGLNSRLKEAANTLAFVYEEELKNALIASGKQATGSLVESVQAKVRTDGQNVVIEVLAEDYLGYVDRGRRPGKFPPISAIRSWVRVKGISEDAVFPIARKIATQGIPRTGVVNKSLRVAEKKVAEKYEQELAEIIGAVLVNDVFNKSNTKGQILPKSLT